MQILRSITSWNLILMSGMLIAIGACMNDTMDNPHAAGYSGPNAYENNADHAPTYSTNSSDDDNGIAPMPNNGNQNFGRRH